METWEATAREAIRDLVARYNGEGDSGRVEAVVELFAPSASLRVADLGDFEGHAGIRRLLAGVPAPPEDDFAVPRFIRHFTATHRIDVGDECHAQGRCYYQVLTDTGLDHWGRYRDRYVRLDGVWRFADRFVTVDGRREGSWAERNLERMRSAGLGRQV